MTIIYIFLFIGILIFVHELGHFLVAKLFDVKVERFAIGFGPSFATFQGKETEYALCVLPLGGYVQMVGADLESIEDLPEEDRSRALAAKPIWQRSLVVLAGPMANLLLPVAIYFGFGLMEPEAPYAVIGQIHYDTPAEAAGLLPGDKIVEIDGRTIHYWMDLNRGFGNKYEQEVSLVLERDGERISTTIVPELFTTTDPLSISRARRGRIGINLMPSGTLVGITEHDGPAARAGLQFFDKIVSINGEEISRFDEIQSHLRVGEGAPMTLGLLRKISVPVGYAGMYRHRAHTITVTPELIDGEYSLGVAPAQNFIASIDSGGAAEAAGLKPGDMILSIEGRRYNNHFLLTERIESEVNELLAERGAAREDYAIEPEFELEIRRQGEVFTITYVPRVVTFQDDTQHTHYRIDFGWEMFRNQSRPDFGEYHLIHRIPNSARNAVEQTWEFTQMMVVGIWRMVQGRISLRSVGGPIMLGELAAEAGRAGLEPFLKILALISINLAIVNLLPIPVLDGGRLMFYILEGIKRGPLSYRTRQISAYIGLICIILLMILAFKNDIERNWYRVVEYFEER